MAINIESGTCAGVAKEARYDGRVGSFFKQKRRTRVPKIVEGDGR